MNRRIVADAGTPDHEEVRTLCGTLPCKLLALDRIRITDVGGHIGALLG